MHTYTFEAERRATVQITVTTNMGYDAAYAQADAKSEELDWAADEEYVSYGLELVDEDEDDEDYEDTGDFADEAADDDFADEAADDDFADESFDPCLMARYEKARYEKVSGNTVNDGGMILDDQGRYLGEYSEDFARCYLFEGGDFDPKPVEHEPVPLTDPAYAETSWT